MEDKEQKKKDKEKTRKQLKELGILRKSKAGGGLMEATARLKRQGFAKGAVAKGCGAIMSDRKKITKFA